MLKNFKEFAKGKRGVIYLGEEKSRRIAIKVANPKSAAVGNIKREADWLKRLNKFRIGPKLIETNDDGFSYEFVEGLMFRDFIKNASKKEIMDVLRDVLEQCYILDTLHIDKQEMTHPDKHIIVGKKNVLIDFERCKYTLKPSNVTQFMQYICKLDKGLDKTKLLELSAKYKLSYTKKDFDEIMKSI